MAPEIRSHFVGADSTWTTIIYNNLVPFAYCFKGQQNI
jgi:hypothetical protein